ncbi:MAG: alpha/beta fold hydrolase [Pseudomonadales bacterium]
MLHETGATRIRLSIPRALILCWMLALSGACQHVQSVQGHAQGGLEAHTVLVDGHPMRVWEKPRAEPGAVMLLLHGRTWSTRPDFDLTVAGEDLSLMDGLAALGVRAYGMDQRGYGETPRDASGWLTPERAARDVAGVLDWLRGRHPAGTPIYLFGWSYGAMLAQLVAQQQGDALAGLILFGYPVRPGIATEPEGSDGPPPRVPTTAAAAASDFRIPGSISQRAIESFVAAALAADPVRADWRRLAQWSALDGSRITVPTLLLEGHEDPLALDEVQAALFRSLATDDKAWVVIPGGDHAAFMETPRAYFLRHIGLFLERLPGRSIRPEAAP